MEIIKGNTLDGSDVVIRHMSIRILRYRITTHPKAPISVSLRCDGEWRDKLVLAENINLDTLVEV